MYSNRITFARVAPEHSCEGAVFAQAKGLAADREVEIHAIVTLSPAIRNPTELMSPAMENSLLLLKLRLLARVLDEIPNYELHAMIIQQSELAFAQAARTAFPELVLPCLFEEQAAAALEVQRHRKTAYWQAVAGPASGFAIEAAER